MSQGRTSPQGTDSRKANEQPTRDNTQSPPVELDALKSNDRQTLIGFSGIGIDGAILALSDPDVTHDDALQIAHQIVSVAGGVA